MHKATIDEIDSESHPGEIYSIRRPVSDAVDAEHLAMNYFELEPGESFSGGLHTHHDQEEVFYIQSGEATFDVAEAPDSDAADPVSVGAGEVIRFPPGEFQTGYNEADNDERVVALALGAPTSEHDIGEIEAAIPCSECGEETGHTMTETDDGDFVFTCLECGNERRP
ncbi:cupin domain-containing protein [Natronomonas sp. LN261]|jgi:mannose-6-phosphate isomerase-like protein (cupin superfamily)|uniref:cupin domain-containing protein n=1 Tax=Natronomonas sp. LN261 TaxID=2750669 RepID=UPI0015EF9A0E|nr:cupin domain-containing protein [Natronomonas sp. LN261]